MSAWGQEGPSDDVSEDAPSGAPADLPQDSGTAGAGEPPSPAPAPTEPLSLDAVRAASEEEPETSEEDTGSADGDDTVGDGGTSRPQEGSATDDADGASDGESAREPEAARTAVAGTVTDVQSFESAPSAPDSDDRDGNRTEEFDEAPVAETASLWPSPRRLSDYVSEPSDDDGRSEETGTGGTGAAAGATTTAAAYSAGTPGESVGSAAAGSGGFQDSHGASSSQPGPTGPGGPKGPAGPGGTGPGGPKGPGDPRSEKKEKTRKPLWWRALRALLIVTGVFVIIGCGAFAFLYSTVEVPDAAKADALEQGSTFYFADGETEFAYRGTDREILSYDEMTEGGDHVVEAVISAEDRGFWSEPGVSVSGTGRAVWSTVTGKQVQGGSTVTQQMVRNYYEGVSREVSVARKLQEIIISIKVDQSESKEWVMEQYLNTIYFGRRAYGVQAAAEAYYHKDVTELDAAEAAFLAAAIQQPTYFGEADVETTPEMERRWQYVVNGMVTTGAITQAEADEMEFPRPEPEKPADGSDLSGYRGYMYEAAMRELTDLGYTEDQINRQGYTIVTTFDRDMMDTMYRTIEETMDPEQLPEGVNVGATTIDPETGEVLASYGGHDYNANQYDSALLGGAQAGSSFKPYVLATALKQGYSLNSMVDGRGPRHIAGSSDPIQNAGNAPGGVMSLTDATRVSNNLGYIELAMETGQEEVRETAYDLGVAEGSILDDQLVPTMALGVSTVRPVDQASAYASFANGGVHVDAHVVKEIVNTQGEDERPEVESNRAISEDNAADVTHALQQVVNGGTGTAANIGSHPVAGKTGTTTDSVAAWFVGYTPQLSTAVGVYSGDNQEFTVPGYGALSGGTLPATMWRNYMSEAMSGYEREEFPPPAYAGSTQYWAPDPSTQEPAEPPQDDSQPEEPVEEPQEPAEPPEPETPIEPEPVDPGPEIPGFPGPDPSDGEDGGGGGEDFGTPPGRGDEDW